jgi:NADPH:quinone reductase-like Zn-dependent oxidoreductase
LAFGISGPRRKVLGSDLSGVVEAVGDGVTRFRAGDEVFGSVGMRLGSHAELAVARDTGAVVRKPAAMSFEDAAALPFGGATALYFLRDVGRVRTGERVLITGASGAVGSAAVQIAKTMGAHVTGMASGRNAALVRALGADEAFDRETTDLAATGLRWDVVLDVANVVPFARGRTLLGPGGRLLLVAASLWTILAAPVRSRTGRLRVAGGVVPERADDILALGRMAETGALRAVIDSRFPLARIAEAHARASGGQKVGNVLVTMGSD